MQNNSFETLGELFEKKDISVDGRKLGAWINEHKHAVNKSGLKNILSLSDREIQKIAKEIESIDIELLLKNKADRKTLSEKYIEKAKSFNLRFRQSDEHEHLDSLYCIGKSIMYYRDEHDKELEKLLDETEQFIHTFYFNKLQWREYKGKKNPLEHTAKLYDKIKAQHNNTTGLIEVGKYKEKDEIFCKGLDGRVWYYCTQPHSQVDSESLNHCGAPGAEHRIISLRDRYAIKGKDYWRCYVSAGYSKNQKNINQIRSMSNSEVPKHYYGDVFLLLKELCRREGLICTEKTTCLKRLINNVTSYLNKDAKEYEFLDKITPYGHLKDKLLKKHKKIVFDEDAINSVPIACIDFCFINRLINDEEMKDVGCQFVDYIFANMEVPIVEIGTFNNFVFVSKYHKFTDNDVESFSQTLQTKTEVDKFMKMFGFRYTCKVAILKHFGFQFLEEMRPWLCAARVTEVILQMYEKDKQSVRDAFYGKDYSLNKGYIGNYYKNLDSKNKLSALKEMKEIFGKKNFVGIS